jgi:DNA topoisomerase VI subunit B
MSMLERKTFATSRLAEFTSTNELTKQTGHPPGEWPLVILKELVDNAADEAEKAKIAPVVDITVDGGGITIADNGSGIAATTVERMLDYTVRVSDKEAYVSPTRGAQGNALKTLIAMPFALDGSSGETTIEARSITHSITFTVDPIRHEPKIERVSTPGLVTNGTRITIGWPESACSELENAKARFLQIASDFTFLNPHMTLTVEWDGDLEFEAEALNSTWTKWSPSDPIPPHWYTVRRFDRLIGAHIAHDQDHGGATTVREFVATFRGLKGTQKQSDVLSAVNASRLSLAEFYNEGRNPDRTIGLLATMQREGRPVKPDALGEIGRDYLERRFQEANAEMETFDYIKLTGMTDDDLPWVVEAAFAWSESALARRLITGVNFSATIINPFRSLNFAQSLDSLLADNYAGQKEPVIILAHLVCPRLSFTDRGKTALALAHGEPGMVEIGKAIAKAATKVTAAWAKQRKAEIRDASRAMRRRERLSRVRKLTVKDAAYEVMEEAYLKASANGTLPANARQIMYAARPKVQEATGKLLDDQYFIQTLLPDYIAEHEVEWDVAFDDRGHFIEPHGGQEIGLGTLNVRRYLNGLHAPRVTDGEYVGTKVSTHGPQGNYGAVLFIEKEGFLPLLEHVGLGDRFDIAIMSTKGMSVVASRQLAERLCSERGIPLYILHDFDKAGFAIKSTLHRDTRRHQFRDRVQAVDLGLRLDDVVDLGLEQFVERASDDGAPEARAANMRKNGATDKEIAFLLQRRVELNAMTSEQFVGYVERKLMEHGVRKVIPDAGTLAQAYRSNIRSAKIEEIIDKMISEITEDEVKVPDDLADQIADLLRKNPSWRWDDAVAEIARPAEPAADKSCG